MNPNKEETRLEAEVDALLKGLPHRPAPAMLLPRVMAAIESRRALPWFRQSWHAWPLAVRLGALLALTAIFVGLCLTGRALPSAGAYAAAANPLGGWFWGAHSLWHVLGALAATGLTLFQQLPAGFGAACLASLLLAYALCVGLGAAWMRFAFARR